MKKYIKTAFFAVLFLAVFQKQAVPAQAAVTWKKSEPVEVVSGNHIYRAYLSKDKKRSWIFQVKKKIVAEGTKVSEMKFPKKVKKVPVTKIGGPKAKVDAILDIWGNYVEPWHEYDGYEKKPQGIKKVVLPPTVKTITRGTFCGMRSLVSIQIPDLVEQIPYAAFYNCVDLQKVILPKNLKDVDTNAFESCGNFKKFQLSKENGTYACVKGILLSKDGKTFCYPAPGKKYVKIPEGVETIATGAFTCSMVRKVWIPRSVSCIEDASLCGGEIRKILLQKDHPYYGEKRNCIYSKREKSLVAFVCKNGTVTLPKQVKYLTNKVSAAGKMLEKLVIPETIKKIRKNCFPGHWEFLGAIYFQSETPPKAAKGSLFYLNTFYVPKGSLEVYAQWFKEILGTEDGERADVREY